MNKHLFTIFSIFIISHCAFSQGCSDAGFCTMGAMKPDQSYSQRTNFKLNAIEISQYRGKTTLTPIIYVTNIDFAFSLNKTSFQVKLPYQVISGNLGNTSGIGDISLSATRSIYSTDQFNLNATIGAKIPSNNSDLKKEDDGFQNKGSHFPMYYQTSLGSYDIIAGISIISKKWLFAAGYQNALTANNNQFLWGEWNDYPGGRGYIDKHDIAFKLKRGTDLMFRAERNWRFANYNFSLGALPIYRITKDQNKRSGEFKKLAGTTGLALTMLGSAGYHFNVNTSIKFIFGLKLVDRDVNPDQLTRNSVQTIAYVYRF